MPASSRVRSPMPVMPASCSSVVSITVAENGARERATRPKRAMLAEPGRWPLTVTVWVAGVPAVCAVAGRAASNSTARANACSGWLDGEAERNAIVVPSDAMAGGQTLDDAHGEPAGRIRLLPCARITSIRFKGTVSVAPLARYNTPSEVLQDRMTRSVGDYGRPLRPTAPKGPRCIRPSGPSCLSGRGHSQQLVQALAGGGVLQQHRLIGPQARGGGKRGQRGLVEDAEDQLLLARVGDHVAHRKDAGRAGLEVGGIYHQQAALPSQAPLADRAQLGADAQAGHDRVGTQAPRAVVVTDHLHGGQRMRLVVGLLDAEDLPHFEAHTAAGDVRLQSCQRTGLGRQRGAAVQQRDAGRARLLGIAIDGIGHLQHGIDGGILAAHHQHLPAGQQRGLGQAVEELSAEVALNPIHLQQARLEGTHTTGDEHAAGDEGLTGTGVQLETTIIARRQGRHLLAEVKTWGEGYDLPQQPIDQFTPGAHLHRGDVVDRLVGVQLYALTAGHRQRIHHLGVDALHAEPEDLEQAHRAGADDQRVTFDGAGGVCAWRGARHVRQRINSESLSLRSFQSSASGNGALRLVMLGQPLARSALSLMKASWSLGTSSSGRIALTGHSGMHTAQSMHSSGSMVRKFGPSRKQSTGHTSTQSVYLQRMHDSRTTWVMGQGGL